MRTLLTQISQCQICRAHLPHGVNPVVQANTQSRIVIIGQAPGLKVHQTGIPWNDPSGERLREWMRISEADFYHPSNIALIPMSFCYPGKGKTGDLPPRPECAPQWHEALFKKLKKAQLYILIGQYAQRYYLGDQIKANLTQTVKHYKDYLPHYFVLPHPSPRNRLWLKKNPWFDKNVLPAFRKQVQHALNH